MNRLVVLLVLAAPATGGDWQKRQSEFHAKASAERKQLGLDSNAVRAKYPTPEVTFSGAGSGGGAAASCVVLCPGKTGKFVLKGKLPQGSLVLVQSNDVEVVEEKQTSSGWEATVKAKPDAPPELLGVSAISAVSGIQVTVPGLEIGCEHTFTFEVAGDTMVLKVTFPCGQQETTATGEWRRAGKVLGSYTYQVRRGQHSLSLDRQVPQEEAMAQGQGAMAVMQSKEWKDLDQRFNAVMAKVNACTKGPQNQIAPCMQKLQPEMDAINKERQALMDASEKKNSLKFGCGALEVEANAGKLKGTATQCAGHKNDDRLSVTGTYTSP
ncbi:MAG TPA: hypothetical protein VLT82_06080 [Myxococcaceae bacterium]|nr:hypothetical protein [Myxococcaceae bacterium]